MRFEDSKYFNELNTKKLKMPFGAFYLCDKFYLAEIFEGTHLDYIDLKNLMIEIVKFYGENKKIGFISNRVNSYSINPHLYNRIDEEFNIIIASAFVIYSDISYMNATIEKRFTKRSIKRCVMLDEAIDWILNIEELN